MATADAFIYILFGIAALYLILIAILTFSWLFQKQYKKEDLAVETYVTVIVPVKNEEQSIEKCLQSIVDQHFPKEFYEVLVVDDHSSDKTPLVVADYIKSSEQANIRLIQMACDSAGELGKKAALKHGIHEAKGSLIVTIDGDCEASPHWLSLLVNAYQAKRPVFISAPVFYYVENSVLSKIQALEFLSLVASGGASVKAGFPIMCNGANLAFEKNAFYEVKGYEGNLEYASGDDIFLMLKMKKKYPQRVMFLKSFDSSVYTRGAHSFSEFFNQRKRWVSKSRGYSDFKILFSAFLVFLMNFSILLSGVLGLYDSFFMKISGLFFAVKIITDLPIMTAASIFAERGKLMLWYLPTQLINVVYVPIIAVSGLFGKFVWKREN